MIRNLCLFNEGKIVRHCHQSNIQTFMSHHQRTILLAERRQKNTKNSQKIVTKNSNRLNVIRNSNNILV